MIQSETLVEYCFSRITQVGAGVRGCLHSGRVRPGSPRRARSRQARLDRLRPGCSGSDLPGRRQQRRQCSRSRLPRKGRLGSEGPEVARDEESGTVMVSGSRGCGHRPRTARLFRIAAAEQEPAHQRSALSRLVRTDTVVRHDRFAGGPVAVGGARQIGVDCRIALAIRAVSQFCVASWLRETRPRRTLVRISSAVAVQTNGSGFSLLALR